MGLSDDNHCPFSGIILLFSTFKLFFPDIHAHNPGISSAGFLVLYLIR
jgi:hypothetical protein